MTGYLLHVMIIIAIYAMVASSLDLLVGQTGLLSLAQAAFFGLGAYTTAILNSRFGVSLVMSAPIGCLVAAALSLIVSLPSARLKEDYFALCTFGFQIVISSVFLNRFDLTGGAMGISGIAPLLAMRENGENRLGEAIVVLVLCSLALLQMRTISRSPFGRALRAIREDEVFAQSLGKDTAKLKIRAALISTALAALSGSLYARYTTYIDPSLFAPGESIILVSMIIIGGIASTGGALLGAAIVIGLPEALRFVGISGALAANLRQIMYGSLLIVVVLLRPSGLVGRYSIGRR